MATCPNCGLWEGLHASGEYCRCNEDGWHNAQPIPQPEPDVPAEAHTAQCAAYQSRIAALESQVKALTEERDQARRERADAQHRYTVAMHDISKACEGTTARSACEVVEFWRKERNAQAEAVRKLGNMVQVLSDQRTYERTNNLVPGNGVPSAMLDAWEQVNANPIARAAVEAKHES